MKAAATLSDAQLDRAFEMGCGSFRVTLIHIHEAMYWWVGIIKGEPDRPEPPQDESLGHLRERWIRTRREIDAIVASDQLERSVSYPDRRGNPRNNTVGEILLHVLTHGTHHRAQALNMLRQLGATVPKLDYMVMLRERAS